MLVSKLIFRVVLPLSLLAAALIRYNGMSLAYLFCLLLIPLVPSPSRLGPKTSIRLQSLILAVSLTFILSHIIFQVLMVKYFDYFKKCSHRLIFTEQIGLYMFNECAADSKECQYADVIRILSPDVVVFLTSLFAVLSCRSLSSHSSRPGQMSLQFEQPNSYLGEIIPVFAGLMLLLGGIIQPNVLTSVYFIAFLVLGICWAFHLLDHLKQNTSFLVFKLFLTVYAGLHLILLYLYQFPFMQTALLPDTFLPRLLGLPAIILNHDCARSHQIILNFTYPWPFYVYPFSVFLLYWMLAADLRIRMKKKYAQSLTKKPKSDCWQFLRKDDSPLLETSHTSHYGAIEEPQQPTIIVPETTQEPSDVQGLFSSIMMFLMRQSYIAALIIMMTWSITYHSWLTFVLLLWACMTWITPYARKFCMVSSPYLVIYAELLLILQYIYGMNLKDDELPVKEGKFDFSELGLMRSNYQVIHLGAQTLFTWVFLVTLRQYLREKKMQRPTDGQTNDAERSAIVLTSITRPIVRAFRRVRSKSSSQANNSDEIDSIGVRPSRDAKILMSVLKKSLAKYWILVCCAAFLLVALQDNVSLHQIFYMVIFLFGFIIYQFSVRTWKTVLRPLWWFMVIYSIVVLLAIYTYQFDNMPQYWHNGTHLSYQWLEDIGLRKQDKAGLLLELLIPTIFSIILVIQLHFFHKPLMNKIKKLMIYRKEERKKRTGAAASTTVTDGATLSTDMTSSTLATTTGYGSISDEDEDNLHPSFGGKLKRGYSKLTFVLWRFAEIHWPKFVCLVVMVVALQQVSAVNACFIVCVAIAMLNDMVQKFMNYVMIVWSSIVVLVFMIYQLQFVKEDILQYNCTEVINNKTVLVPAGVDHFASNEFWLGFHKSSNVSQDVRGYLFIVLVIVFQKVIKHHQELHRYHSNTTKLPTGILFDGVTRKEADESIFGGFKYLCNHFFANFGVESNLVVMVIAVCTRGDVISVLHSIWIGVFLFAKRRHVVKIWRIYVWYLAILIPAQYISILGWPPALCKDYPWTNAFGSKTSGLTQWLFLTNQQMPQNQQFLLADFFQYLAACCQMNAIKNSHKNTNPNINDVTREEYSPPDFMNNKTWLDFIKILFLEQFLWLTLTIVYVTAQSTTSLFNSGFIVGCFFFLWHGQGLYLRPRYTMKTWWKYFLAYIYVVIISKLWLQLVSCVYINAIFDETNCFIIQLLNLYCIHPEAYDIPSNINSECVTENDPGLVMDTICFIVALAQYMIFKSKYFRFVIREHRRQSEMASRGAQLVEERLQIRLTRSIEDDKMKMQLIRDKVARLKEKLAELHPNHQEPISHYEAIYSGDYYLFDTSGSESDSEDRETSSPDLTMTTPPQQTSEQVKDQPDGVIGEINVEIVEIPVTEDKDGSSLSKPSTSSTTTALEEEEEQGAASTKLRKRRRKHKITSDQTMDIVLDHDRPPDEATADQTEEPESVWKSKLKEYATICGDGMVTFTNAFIKALNETSTDYRQIASQLHHERKERAKIILERPPPPKVKSLPDLSRASSGITKDSSSSLKEEEPSDTWSLIPTEEEEDEQQSWKKNDSILVQLLLSLYYALLANTDLLCYSFMIINHIYYASILSMPLPFFVFLWGMLSIPRPTKRFWITVITYVELVIVVKYIFQFKLPTDEYNSDNDLNFNECSYYKTDYKDSPLCPPRIIGVERNQWSTSCDLLLLLCLFFHRFAMKKHGLWKEKAYNDEEDLSPVKTPDVFQEQRPPIIDFDDRDAVSSNSQQNVESGINRLESSINKGEIDDEELPSRSHQKKSCLQNIGKFLNRMLDPSVGTGAVDVYAWMFAAQFIVFVIILSSWSAFSSSEEGHSNFAKIIEQNVVPKTFLYMLLTQFLLIVVDRYMYMRKQILAKLIYQALLVLVLHVFLFIMVPYITKRPFTKNVPAIFLYLFICIYFGLSAYQVRCGYPTRILGNFLTKNYTVTSGILFQGIQAIPFLLELRSVLDWVCTQTTLTLNHWLKMEDIYANIFIMKCWRDSEKTWPHRRGEAYWTSSKWLIGGILLTLLIVVIWFPLLLMSFISSAYISNKPVEVTFTLTIGGYQPLFRVTTQQQFLKDLSDRDISKLVDTRALTQPGWDASKAKLQLLDYKKNGNIIRIQVLSNSSAIWTISPPSRDFLIKDLESNNSISLQFKYEFNREPNTTQAAIVQESVSGINTRPLHPGDPIRKQLAQVLRNPQGGGNISLSRLFPSFMSVPASGPVNPVRWLDEGTFVNCTIIQRRGSTPFINNSLVEWWEIVQDSPKPIFLSGPGYLEIFALSDLVPPLHLSFFASTGIIGLYVGFVWLVGKFVRIFFTSISYRIMYDELPNVDRILKLCLEIYMVRESKELKLEEDLFAKLLFLYRSPETLIKWTKYKRLKTS